jgi:hypothetical protein
MSDLSLSRNILRPFKEADAWFGMHVRRASIYTMTNVARPIFQAIGSEEKLVELEQKHIDGINKQYKVEIANARK